MGDGDDLGTLAWRVRKLEFIEAALRSEVHELRSESMTTERVRTIVHEFLEHEDRLRRERWPVWVSAVCMVCSVASVVLGAVH